MRAAQLFQKRGRERQDSTVPVLRLVDRGHRLIQIDSQIAGQYSAALQVQEERQITERWRCAGAMQSWDMS
jgi:hypothetical protein